MADLLPQNLAHSQAYSFLKEADSLLSESGFWRADPSMVE